MPLRTISFYLSCHASFMTESFPIPHIYFQQTFTRVMVHRMYTPVVGPHRSLLLEGNPLRTMRRAILDKGTPGIMAYLKDRMPS